MWGRLGDEPQSTSHQLQVLKVPSQKGSHFQAPIHTSFQSRAGTY
uniref:Uncharacterized protein n=1 Tax=Mus musculus TaxID=10090 RepID=Q3TS14_MOUSE|nr:unnamed protein product [Mus musculus]